MAKLELYNYQANTVKLTAKSLVEHNSTLVVLPTGGGKSVVIGYIANNIKGRTLILTHRAEILKQNSEWLSNLGVLTAKENTVSMTNTVVIAMVQTLYARIQKEGINYIGQFSSIIIDEAHVDIFQKVSDQYKCRYKIGFTATPTMMKRELVKKEGIEYWKTITLAEQYEDIVVGATVAELILEGRLVEDENYELQLPGMGDLVDDNRSPDGYTTKSLNTVYGNKVSQDILWKAYQDYCVGKKVLIFNATTAINPMVEKLLTSHGVECKSYDSVHSKPKERAAVIEWYANKRDAVLIGTNVFTTGFNETGIEVVIVNRATKSLSLWIQMVGRGSRTTKKFFKDRFRVLDLGQNIQEHGLWSDERDWKAMFIPPKLELRRKKDITVIWECEKCGAYVALAMLECPECGTEKPRPKMIRRPDKTGRIVEVGRTIWPRAKKIITYTEQNNESSNFAYRLLITRLVDMFRQHKVKRSWYINKRSEFLKRIHKIATPIYFGIMNSELKGSHKKLDTYYKQIDKAIDKYYDYKHLK